MTYRNIFRKKSSEERRGVAPIIATLLMVAIAVVGGILIFVFAQGFFSQSQVSSAPTIESVTVVGYDARDINALTMASGTAGIADSGSIAANVADNKIQTADKIAIYVKNNGAQDMTISSLQVAGLTYTFDNDGAGLATISTEAGNYTIVATGTGSTSQNTPLPTLSAGQIVTIVPSLTDALKVGRDVQVKILTTNGNTFLGTILVGSTSG